MKTKTIKLYSFDELSGDVQKKVLDNMRDLDTQGEWYETIEDEFKEDMKELGITDVKIYFSGFSSQGDGASFTGHVDIEKFLDGFPAKKKEFPDAYNKAKDININIKKSGHYEHEYTMYTDCELVDIATVDDQEQLEQEILDIAKEEARRLYKLLEKEYEYLSSDEHIAETLRDVGYLFRENGTFEGINDEQQLESIIKTI